ncbi:MAG: prepilin-type N-terminal cleavage/methylation domain-containing protein [Gemmatimonadota bacterium]|nr:prepilin-type N-terminal cleavage/methylation domain-containing protein [Gemmatimonadota bacterium]
MTARRAFTLVEVSAAIAITGMVALIAYGTFRAALDTGDRSAQLRERVEAAALVEQMVSAAARHAVDAIVPGYPAFELTHSIAPSGQPADHLSFLSRGILEPRGATGLWMIKLDLVGHGVRFTAVPADSLTSGALATTLPGVTGLRVRAMGSGPDGQWHDTWTALQPLPAAVIVELVSSSGAPAFSPMLLRVEGRDMLR